MKRYLLSVVVMVLLFANSKPAAWGQYSDLYYHRIGDTIVDDAPIYRHNWWGFLGSLSTHETYNVYYSYSFVKQLSYYYTPDTLKVIGLAFMKPYQQPVYSNNIWPYDDSTLYQEYLLLYDAGPDSVRLLTETPWNIRQADPRYLSLEGNGRGEVVGVGQDSCCMSLPWRKTYPVYEYYFDTAFYVTDSFYVGMTNNGSEWNYIPYSGDPQESVYRAIGTKLKYRFAGNVGAGSITCNGLPGECEFHWPGMRQLRWADSLEYYNLTGVPMVFPIVQIDTTVPPPDYCPEVTNIQVEDLGNGSVMITWEDCPNYINVEVSIGRSGQAMSQWSTRMVDDNYMVLNDLEADVIYCVRMRAWCDKEKMTEWSRIITFQSTGVQGPEGVPSPNTMSAHVHVSPNPTSDRTTVSSDYVITHVEVLDAYGKTVISSKVWSRSFTFSTQQMTAGHYIVLVTTSAGRVGKVLEVF